MIFKILRRRISMRKIIILVLAIILALTNVSAVADIHATPSISTFATMKTKYNKQRHIITITLSQDVDRLLVNWADIGEEPEELLVNEDLKATALTWNHKYMPGTTQYFATSETDVNKELKEKYKGTDKVTKKRIYKANGYKLTGDTSGAVWNVTEIGPVRVLEYGKADSQIDEYKADYGFDEYKIVMPYQYFNEKGKKITVKGSVQGWRNPYKVVNPGFQTAIATPDQIAYLTEQDGWAVYYNREGKIVGVEFFDGQF